MVARREVRWKRTRVALYHAHHLRDVSRASYARDRSRGGAYYTVQNTPRIVWFSKPTYFWVRYDPNRIHEKVQDPTSPKTIVRFDLKSCKEHSTTFASYDLYDYISWTNRATMLSRYGQNKKGGIRESKNYGIPEWHSRMAFPNGMVAWHSRTSAYKAFPNGMLQRTSRMGKNGLFAKSWELDFREHCCSCCCCFCCCCCYLFFSSSEKLDGGVASMTPMVVAASAVQGSIFMEVKLRIW